MSGLNVGQTMARVEAELARRPQGRDRDPEVAPVESDASMGFEMRPAYALHDLLQDADEAFVRTAYLAVLRREPDPDGLSDHLRKLRSGQLTRVEIVAALRWSPEGREKGVHIDGLLLPTLLHRWRRIRAVGPVIAWFHGLVRLGTLHSRLEVQAGSHARALSTAVERLSRFDGRLEAQVAVNARALSAAVERLSHLETRSRESLADFATSLSSFECAVREMQARTDGIDAALERTRGNLKSGIEQTQAELARVQAEQEAALERSRGEARVALEHAQRDLRTAVEQAKAVLGSALVQARSEAKGASEALGSHLAQARTDLDALLASSQVREERERLASERQQALDPLYVDFEQRFRGESSIIRARAMPYVNILRDAQVGTPAAPVLDVGCGNGDWLDVMREHGFVARGVDSNSVFVEACRQRGLDVTEADAIAYLESLPAGSLGGVTGMHIAEHLPFDILVRLIDESLRVLCVGGVLALETPNPENLLVGSHYFYMDPTHRNPLPPMALQWLVEARGFQLCRIERWTVAREMDVPAPLPPEEPAATAVNGILDLLRMAPDYAIIARRL